MYIKSFLAYLYLFIHIYQKNFFLVVVSRISISHFIAAFSPPLLQQQQEWHFYHRLFISFAADSTTIGLDLYLWLFSALAIQMIAVALLLSWRQRQL